MLNRMVQESSAATEHGFDQMQVRQRVLQKSMFRTKLNFAELLQNKKMLQTKIMGE
jgi:hypothetical protein